MADEQITEEQRAALAEELLAKEAIIQASLGRRPPSDAGREQRLRRFHLAKAASHCMVCNNELEEVWRFRGSDRGRVVPFCRDCVPEHARIEFDYAERQQCATCGRGVYEGCTQHVL